MILPELVSSPWLKIHQSINAASITHTLYLCSFDEKKTLFLGPWEPRLLAVKNYSCHFRYLYYLRILCIKIKLFAISLTSDNKGVVLLLFRRSLQTRTNLEWLFVVINITYLKKSTVSCDGFSCRTHARPHTSFLGNTHIARTCVNLPKFNRIRTRTYCMQIF